MSGSQGFAGASPAEADAPDMMQAAHWAIRLFLGREPFAESEVEHYAALGSIEAMRRGILQNGVALRSLARLAPRGEDYRVPLFLLRPGADPAGVPCLFERPSLAQPTSQMCTYDQFEEADYARHCATFGSTPGTHRKQWEFCFILAAIERAGLLRPGVRALGFGTGREPLPSVFARHGMRVTATDAPIEVDRAQGWAEGNQHSSGLGDLHDPALVDRATFLAHATWRAVDMNAIPDDLRGYDLCWSACALEHLGSIARGLDFIVNSVACLRPGGYAVHTTEFNLSSDTETLDVPGLCLFRRRDIEAVANRLARAGHEVWPLNFHPGDAEIDAIVDTPPYALPHLKLEVADWVTTSFGLVVRRGG